MRPRGSRGSSGSGYVCWPQWCARTGSDAAVEEHCPAAHNRPDKRTPACRHNPAARQALLCCSEQWIHETKRDGGIASQTQTHSPKPRRVFWATALCWGINRRRAEERLCYAARDMDASGGQRVFDMVNSNGRDRGTARCTGLGLAAIINSPG